MTDIPPPRPKVPIPLIIAIGIVGAALIATFYFGLAGAIVATVRSFVS